MYAQYTAAIALSNCAQMGCVAYARDVEIGSSPVEATSAVSPKHAGRSVGFVYVADTETDRMKDARAGALVGNTMASHASA